MLFVVWFGLHSLALFYDIAHGSATSISGRAVAASVGFWSVELSAVALILSRQARQYYRHKPAEA